MSIDRDVLERFGWTPDQIVIKRVGEVGAEIPGWTASGMVADTDTFYPGQPRDSHGRWTKGMGAMSGGALYPKGHLGDSIEVDGAGRNAEKIRSIVNYAGGNTTKIKLTAVAVVGQREMDYGSYGTVLGRYMDPDGNTPLIKIGSVAMSRKATDLHKEALIGLDQGRNYDVPTGRVNDGLKVTLTHEIGHAADYSMSGDQRDEMFDRLADAIDLPRPSVSSANREWWVSDHYEALTKALSQYATGSSAEIVGEAWCEYILSNEPRPAARAVGKYIEEALG